jgi:hypothetical protein
MPYYCVAQSLTLLTFLDPTSAVVPSSSVLLVAHRIVVPSVVQQSWFLPAPNSSHPGVCHYPVLAPGSTKQSVASVLELLLSSPSSTKPPVPPPRPASTVPSHVPAPQHPSCPMVGHHCSLFPASSSLVPIKVTKANDVNNTNHTNPTYYLDQNQPQIKRRK